MGRWGDGEMGGGFNGLFLNGGIGNLDARAVYQVTVKDSR